MASERNSTNSPADIMSLLTSDDDSLSEGSPLLDESDSVVLLSSSSANQIRSPTESTKELYKQLGLGMPSSEIGRKCSIKHSRTPSSDPTEVTIISSTGGSFVNKKTTLDNNSNIVYQSSQSLASPSNSRPLLHQQKATSTSSSISGVGKNLIDSDLGLKNLSDRELSLCSLTPTSTFNKMSPSRCTLSVSDEISMDKSILTSGPHRRKAGVSAPPTPAVAGEDPFYSGGVKPKKKKIKMFTRKRAKTGTGNPPNTSPQSGSPLRVIWYVCYLN